MSPALRPVLLDPQAARAAARADRRLRRQRDRHDHPLGIERHVPDPRALKRKHLVECGRDPHVVPSSEPLTFRQPADCRRSGDGGSPVPHRQQAPSHLDLDHGGAGGRPVKVAPLPFPSLRSVTARPSGAISHRGPDGTGLRPAARRRPPLRPTRRSTHRDSSHPQTSRSPPFAGRLCRDSSPLQALCSRLSARVLGNSPGYASCHAGGRGFESRRSR